MNKEEFIAKYGEAAYAKALIRNEAWRKTHPEEHAALTRKWQREYSRKGGKYYENKLKHDRTGLRGERNKIRSNHRNLWREYKRIIAPLSQIHHEWIPGTANYRGVALVEKDQHMHGFVNPIEILEGSITLFTEEDIKGGI